MLAVASAVVWWMLDAEAAMRWAWQLLPQEPDPPRWRWWTAALVHVNESHLQANLWAAGVTAAWGFVARAGAAQAMAWLLAWPLTHALLITDPGTVTRYAGLSATLHAGAIIICWHLTVHHHGARRAVGCIVAAAIGIKLALEVPMLQAWWRGGHAAEQLLMPLSGAPGHVVAGHAHGCGVLAGLVAAAVVDGVLWSNRLRAKAASSKTAPLA